MARGGGGEKAKSLEDLGVSKEEIMRLTIQVYERNQESTKKYLTDAIKSMNKVLGREDKVKGGLVDLASQVACLAKTVSGLVEYHKAKREEAQSILEEVTSEREDITGKFEMVEDDNGKMKRKIITSSMNSGKITRSPTTDTEAAITARYKIKMYEVIYGTSDKLKEKPNE